MFLSLQSVDPSLGRLDYDSLSDQALMEIFCSPLELHTKLLQDENGHFLDVCEWQNVVCTDGRVTRIRMNNWIYTEKPATFEYIPPLVTHFEAEQCFMRGTLDTRVLPAHLIEFDVYKSLLRGTVDFRGFPRGLQDISISYNSFCGSCSLVDLPNSTSHLYAGNNQFSGEISLNQLPSTLEILLLDNNKLHGSVVLKNLPQALLYLDLSGNDFTGDFKLLDLPSSLAIVSIYRNKWSGTAILQKSSVRMPFRLTHDNINKVLDEDGNTHEWEPEIVAQQMEL